MFFENQIWIIPDRQKLHNVQAPTLPHSKPIFLKQTKPNKRFGAIFLQILYDWNCYTVNVHGKRKNSSSLWHFWLYAEHQGWSRNRRIRSLIVIRLRVPRHWFWLGSTPLEVWESMKIRIYRSLAYKDNRNYQSLQFWANLKFSNGWAGSNIKPLQNDLSLTLPFCKWDM
jgi:hypothetical protein